jgi:hypothetical protein
VNALVIKGKRYDDIAAEIDIRVLAAKRHLAEIDPLLPLEKQLDRLNWLRRKAPSPLRNTPLRSPTPNRSSACRSRRAGRGTLSRRVRC